MAKKVLSIALALLMIVNVFAVAVSAASDSATITLAVDNASPVPGDTVNVTVSLKATYNVYALQLMLAYDSACYELVDGSVKGALADATADFTSVEDSATLEAAAAEDGISVDANADLLRVGYTWLPSLGATAPASFANDTAIATFQLKVIGDEGSTGAIKLASQFTPAGTTPSFDTRLANYVGKGTDTIVDSLTNGQLYGNAITANEVTTTVGTAACEHVGGEPVIEGRVEATPTTPGYYYSVVYCTKCSEQMSSTKVDIPATGHTTGATEEVITKAATCTEEGSKDIVVYCSCCTPAVEISRSTVEIPATGHTEVDLPAVAATCTAPGKTAGKQCTVCNVVTVAQTTVSALGHDLKAVVTPPSCTTEGYTTTTCTRCDYNVVSDYTAPSDHSYTVEVSVTPATCTEAGSKTLKCSGCTETITKEIEALGHTDGEVVVENNVNPDCLNAGSYDKVTYCTACSIETSRETITVEALGHTDGEVVVENNVNPDCTNTGSYDNVIYCTVCSVETSRETITVDALGHTELPAVEENRVEPTIEKDGSYDLVVYCSVCGAEVSSETVVLSSFNKAEAQVTTVISKDKVSADDIVTVTVKLSANFNVSNVQIPVIFDKTQFEVVGTKTNKNYLTFGDMFTSRNYSFGGRADQQKAMEATSNAGLWNTDEAKAQYGVAYILASYDPAVGMDDTTIAKPQDDIVATFQLKALKDVEDTSASVFVSEDFAKTEENKKGMLVVGMVAAEDYADWTEETEIFYGYVTYTTKTIAIAGVTVTGTVTSFDDKIDNSDDVTITFTSVDSDAVYTATATGSGAQTYELTEVVAGTYTVTVSKANHVTRTYEVVVGEENITQDLVIHLLGDITGDGKANTIDVARANAHAKSTSLLTGYALECAKINADDKVNTVDVARINAHAKGTASLWS